SLRTFHDGPWNRSGFAVVWRPGHKWNIVAGSPQRIFSRLRFGAAHQQAAFAARALRNGHSIAFDARRTLSRISARLPRSGREVDRQGAIAEVNEEPRADVVARQYERWRYPEPIND